VWGICGSVVVVAVVVVTCAAVAVARFYLPTLRPHNGHSIDPELSTQSDNNNL
jgi:hypothetical protein